MKNVSEFVGQNPAAVFIAAVLILFVVLLIASLVFLKKPKELKVEQ
ncbi:MAG: hypothetical protein Q8L64_04690 [bacterium]|nr:hypothetical protein [bacterium]